MIPKVERIEIPLFENFKETDLKIIAQNFVRKLPNNFLKELQSHEGTQLSDGITIPNDGAFYSLIGKYISRDNNYAKVYDRMGDKEKEDIDEIVSDLICDKFDIEF